MSLVQNGSTLNILGYPATINGRVISWSGITYPDPPGTTSSSGSLTLAEDYNSLSGTENWSYSEAGYACTGITYIAADRISP